MQHTLNCRQIDDCSTHVKLTQVALKFKETLQNVNRSAFLLDSCGGII